MQSHIDFSPFNKPAVPRLERVLRGRIFKPVLLLCFFFIVSVSLLAANQIDSLQKALTIQTRPEDRIKSMMALGKAYYNESDYRKALETDRKLIELINKSGTLKDSAQAFRQIGLVLIELSLFDESLKFLTQAQQYYKQAGDSVKQATCLMNIGIVHDCMGNLPMSLSFYNQALHDFNISRYEPGIGNCKLNIGIILTKQKKYQDAIDHFLSAAELYSKQNNLNYLAAAYINTGLAYKNRKQYDLAEKFHKKAFEIYTQLGDKRNIGYYHVNMGELLLQMNKPEEAKPELELAKTMAEQMGSKELEVKAYEFLSDYYLKTSQYKLAYENLLKSRQINDSIINAKTVDRVSQIQYQYDIAKREAEKMQLVRDNLQSELVISQRTKVMYIMAGFLLMIVTVVVLLSMWIRLKHRANLELEAKNKLILSQKDELVKLNASKDRFLSLLAHDIKNPLSAILGISDILNTDYNQLSDEEKLGFIRDIYTSSSNLFEIINTLLNWSISQNGLIAYQPKTFNISTLCQNSLTKLHPIAKLKDITLINETEPQTTVFADDNMIMSVVHNLVCNAIKYSHRGGEVIVRSSIQNGDTVISIVDNGIGISAENQAKLFRYDQSYRSKGTTGESGTGIGLILCKDFVEKNNGSIWVESEDNKGSAFRFTVPRSKELVEEATVQTKD